jgi:hypothetical protein
MIKFCIILLTLIIIFNTLNIFLSLKKEYYEEEYILPKVIYCYWDKPDDMVNAHINTWKRNIPQDWEINIITLKNLNKYVDESFISRYKNLPAFRFSDFLRLYLLIKHGGVWIDTTTIILDGTFLDKYYNEMITYKYDTTLYEFTKHSKPDYPYLENWFFMSKKNSPFLTDLYIEFDKAFTMGFLKYKIKFLMPNIELGTTIKYGKDTYMLQHAIIHYLLHSGYKYKLNIKDAEESMFKVQLINDWVCKKVIDYIIDNNNWEGYYSIKLGHLNRKGITDENKEKFINKLYSF